MKCEIIAGLLLLFGGIVEASPHRLRVYPNSSLTILAMTEGPDGLLWLAAREGLYRFDGFHYQKITSYPFASARFVASTVDGSLWVGDFEGLARASQGRFDVFIREEVRTMAAQAKRLFVRLDDLTEISPDLSMHHLKHQTRQGLLIDSSNRIWTILIRPPRIAWADLSHPEEMHVVDLPSLRDFEQATSDSAGGVWAADPEVAVHFVNGQAVEQFERRRSTERTRSGPLVSGRNGQLWFVGEKVHGLISKSEFRDRAEHDRYLPTAGVEDSRGHVWVASLDQGLVEWTGDPAWQRWFPENFAGEPSVMVLRDKDGSAVVATHKNLYRWNPDADTWTPLGKEERRYEGVVALDDGGFLAATREEGVVRLSREGRIVERLKDLAPGEQYRKIMRDRTGRIWVGSKRALLRVEGQPGSLRLRMENLPGIGHDKLAQPIDLQVDAEGTMWAGYSEGIAWLDQQNRWHRIDTDQPVTLLRSFALGRDDMWVGHRRNGSFSRLHREGERWKVMVFSSSAGYGPPETHFMKRDSRGWIWRGCPDGVYISDGRHFEPHEWLHINRGNGLAANESDQYGFFEDTDGTVWIAGAEGLTHFRPDASWFDAPAGAPAPKITRVEADGRQFIFPAAMPESFPSTTRTLRIDVGTLHGSPFRDYPLRYRWPAVSQQWQVSRNGSIEFSNPRDRAYTLEVSYAGGGSPAVTSYSFRIGSVAPGPIWLWPIGLLAIAGALVPAFRYIPGLERIQFRIEKAVFLLRRRYGRGRFQSSPGALPAAPDYSGATLADRYDLRKLVSSGGFSAVYDARDLKDGNTRVAVKVLSRNEGRDGWIRDRFAHEVAALRSVEHSGVVRILNSWISANGEPCLAMPFLEGVTLRAALEGNPFSRARVSRIVRQLGEALAEVHSHGIVHRDLKPENMMLLAPESDAEQVVIIDFGTAGLRSADLELAATTLMAGSFHYMAPERLTGHYSPASDVFSLGVIVLEMLTGKRLADLDAMFSDDQFRPELEQTLHRTVGAVDAKSLAQHLYSAYDPDPRRRPGSVGIWAQQVSELLG